MATNPTTDTVRHTVYPYYSLQKAIDVASAVKELGGVNGDVQKAVVAHRLGVDENSPSLLGMLGAAKLYGLIDGRGAYRLTEIAKRYFLPVNEGDRKLAKLQMVKSPPLFSALIDRFDGSRLPPNDTLVNILHRDHHIAESWRPRAVSFFLSSLREAEAIDAAGFVRHKASLHGLGNNLTTAAAPVEAAVDTGPNSPEATSTAATAQSPRGREISSEVDVWSFKIGNQVVRLETSHELSVAAWAKLNQYVQVLKPEGA